MKLILKLKSKTWTWDNRPSENQIHGHAGSYVNSTMLLSWVKSLQLVVLYTLCSMQSIAQHEFEPR